jgi:hypothetical protein
MENLLAPARSSGTLVLSNAQGRRHEMDSVFDSFTVRFDWLRVY